MLLHDILHQIKAARLEYAPQSSFYVRNHQGWIWEPWRIKRALGEAGGDKGVRMGLLVNSSKSACTKIL